VVINNNDSIGIKAFISRSFLLIEFVCINTC
jgi:hypothetical protein